MQYLTTPDIPEGLRPIRYDTVHCRHFQRKFIDYPEEPTGKGKVTYKCVDCGRRKEMKV